MVMLADGRRAKARIHTVSETGGLLRLARALADGDFVEVAFQTQSGPVSGMAEMLHTTHKSQDSVLQAFRFVAMEDDDHKTLTFTVNSTSERNFLFGSSQFFGAK
jgi:hypothetical protein